ncbi:MAG: hypothetical protein JWQ76_1262 [Ramlibacter sp.]|nr:hypothetical protein [Ramlibacter sp.]
MSPGDRFPARKDVLPPEQRQTYEQIEARRGTVPAPFLPLLASPKVADAFERFSASLWSGCLAKDLQEAVFLVTARAYRCDHQWRQHEKKALAAGVSAGAVAAMQAGRAPSAAEADARLGAVIRFADELHAKQSVPDDVFQAVATHLGPAELSELVAFCALAASIALLLNVGESNAARKDQARRGGPPVFQA